MLKFCSLTRRKSYAGDYCNDLLTERRSPLDDDSLKDLIRQRKPIILALSSNITKDSVQRLSDHSQRNVKNYMDVKLRIDEDGIPVPPPS